MLGLMAEFLGATLGSMFFGAALYGLFRSAVSVFFKSPKSCFLISISLSAFCIVLLSAWGFANDGSMNWMMSSLYIPGLILVGFVIYRRDVRGKPAS